MKKLTQLFLVLGLIVTFNVGLVDTGVLTFGDTVSNEAYAANPVFDNNKVDVEQGDNNTEAGNIVEKIQAAANVLAAIVLAISIIMIIIGGLRMILANGNSKQAEEGKMILIYSGIGIIIAISAYALGRLFASFSF